MSANAIRFGCVLGRSEGICAVDGHRMEAGDGRKKSHVKCGK